MEQVGVAGGGGAGDVVHAELVEGLGDVLGHVEVDGAGGVAGHGGACVLGGHVVPGEGP